MRVLDLDEIEEAWWAVTEAQDEGGEEQVAKNFQEKQPELNAFLLDEFEGGSEALSEWFFFTGFLFWRFYLYVASQTKKKLEPVTVEQIEKRLENQRPVKQFLEGKSQANRTIEERLEQCGEGFAGKQPEVTLLALDLLAEAHEEGEPALQGDQLSEIVPRLLTVIGCLDAAVK